jgi:hypothetical protein
MRKFSRNLVVIAALATLVPVTAAQAQYYNAAPQPAPLYPYAVQNNQPYAIEVAPNTYVIRRNEPARAYPYVRDRNVTPVAEPKPKTKRFDRPLKPVDHALVEELRQRNVKRTTVNTTQVVHEKPVIIETQRVVDDPPRVIERYHVAEDAPPARPRRKSAAVVVKPDTGNGDSRGNDKQRVIQADAEVTIIGPDRMSIRLFRKGEGPKANARAE